MMTVTGKDSQKVCVVFNTWEDLSLSKSFKLDNKINKKRVEKILLT